MAHGTDDTTKAIEIQIARNDPPVIHLDPRRMRVAYQGEPGCYSEEAALRFCGEDVKCVPCATFEDAVAAVSEGRAARAVLPVENVLAGTLHANLDLIVGAGVHIVGEVEVDVRHCLLAAPGDTAKPAVARSHPMALMQCSRYLRAAGIRAEVAGDTAGAARELAGGGGAGTCAIASARAGKRYGLVVIAREIGNNAVNYTRFVVLSGAPCGVSRGVGAKTSIAFALDQGPGKLSQALGVFAFHDIDLTKIESRPIYSLGDSAYPSAYPAHAEARWQYLFYIDFVGGVGNEGVDLALQSLQCKTSFFRVLGSYEMFNPHKVLSSNIVIEDAKANAIKEVNNTDASMRSPLNP